MKIKYLIKSLIILVVNLLNTDSELSKFINDKNITDIQLKKVEYTTMTNNPNNQTAEFSSFKRTYDPEIFRIAREREQNPNILSGKDMVYAFIR